VIIRRTLPHPRPGLDYRHKGRPSGAPRAPALRVRRRRPGKAAPANRGQRPTRWSTASVSDVPKRIAATGDTAGVWRGLPESNRTVAKQSALRRASRAAANPPCSFHFGDAHKAAGECAREKRVTCSTLSVSMCAEPCALHHADESRFAMVPFGAKVPLVHSETSHTHFLQIVGLMDGKGASPESEWRCLRYVN
jgi:hypothetical protein